MSVIDPVPAVVGLFAGFIGSLLGVGGGSIITPLLVAMGYDIKTVIPASLLSIVGTSLGGLDVYHREGLIDYRTALRLESSAIIGTMIGVHLVLSVRPIVLKAALSAVLIYVGATSLRKAFASQGEADYGGKPMLGGAREALGIAAGVVKGLVSSLVGVGGGIIGVPILNRILGLEMRSAIATSKMLVGITAASGALGYVLKGALDPCLGISLSLGTIAGAIMGSHVGVRLSNRVAMILFAVFLIVMSIVILVRSG
ncbi:MAG: sulfite exporter TauE/SafE family protein [Desulfurococcales archaeon]|nr:sulfite exporter TauE/SafE family protein [Desulfurococcales archaeon]